MIFLLLYALARQGCSCNATVSRYPSLSEMPDTKKPFRELRNGFLKSCLIAMPEILKISLLMSRIYPATDAKPAHRLAGKLPVINGSDFPNDDAPSLYGTRDGDDTAQRRPGR
jgi:hypothetical protein